MTATLAVYGSPNPKTKEAPRLYSKQPQGPTDAVAPQHQAIHAELEAWGRWCRERYVPGECASIEHRFDNKKDDKGYRATSRPELAMPENEMYRKIDRVVRHMRMNLPDHGEAIVLYYVGEKIDHRKRHGAQSLRPRVVYVPCSAVKICRRLHKNWRDFGPFMDDCRSAVVNLLRRMGCERAS